MSSRSKTKFHDRRRTKLATEPIQSNESQFNVNEFLNHTTSAEQLKLIEPIPKPFDSSMSVPGSKSIALRQMVLSALANDASTLLNVPECDDIAAMRNCLSKLGVRVKINDQETHIDSSDFDRDSELTMDAHMSGVSLRLLLAVAALRHAPTSFVGHVSLAARPNADLLQALVDLGCAVDSVEGRLPIRISPPKVFREAVELDASISSQYLSALLLIAPILPRGLTIQWSGEIASQAYVDITLNEQRRRGVNIAASNHVFHIESNSYTGGNYSIEGDASASTYFMALATLHGSRLHVDNIGSSTNQGDLQFLQVCRRMGASVSLDRDSFTIRGPESLDPIGVQSMESMLDAAPTLMVLAPFLPDRTKITDIANLVYRECDRLHCPERELRRSGVEVVTTTNSMEISPSQPQSAIFDTYDDHRMAMSFAVLASRVPGCLIRNPSCVSKTYTNFWNDFAKLY